MADVRLAGPTIEITAGENLGGNRVVKVADGEAFYASPAVTGDAGKVIGVTTGAVAIGGTALVQVYGPMREVSWTWTPNQPVFMAADGALTQTPPASGWIQQIGIAITATRMFIDLREPITLT